MRPDIGEEAEVQKQLRKLKEDAILNIINGSELDWRLALIDLAVLNGRLNYDVSRIILQPTKDQ